MRVCKAEGSNHAAIRGLSAPFDQVGIQAAAAVFSEVRLKIIRHFAVALHPEVSLGVAALATTVFNRCAFEHRDPGSALSG